MKEFVTAVVQEVEPEDKRGVEFKLVKKDAEGAVEEERVLSARPPRDGQVVMLMARMGRHSSQQDKVAGIIDFFVDVLDEADHQYVVGRLLDWEDPFGIEEVSDILAYLMEEWGGRPTQ